MKQQYKGMPANRPTLTFLAVQCALLTLAAPAWAQQQSLPQVEIKADAETANGPVNGYVAKRTASATKTDTPVLEVPQSVSVVTRDEMDARGVTSLLDVLRYMPGANSETHGVDPRGYEYFNLRGFINAQVTSNFLNGLRQIPGGFGQFRTETYGMERIEVLRGPGSVTFGQADPGGVINRVSKLPGMDIANELGVDIGSFNRKQVVADLNGHTQDGEYLWRVVGLGLDSNNQYKFSNGQSGDNNRFYLAPSLTWRPSASTSLTLMADYMNDRSGSSRWTAVRPGNVLTHTLIGDPNFDRQSNDQWSFGYQFEHKFDNAWTFRQNFRQANLKSVYAALNPGALTGSVLIRGTTVYNSQVDNTLVDNQLEGRLKWGSTEHTVLFGLDWSRMYDREVRYRGTAPSLNINNPVYGVTIPAAASLFGNLEENMNQTGLYAQDQIKFDQRLTLTLGGRWDKVKDETRNYFNRTTTRSDDSALSGRIGLSYLVTRDIAPYVSYATSFLPQTGSDFNGKPFDPTKARQAEVGVKYQPADGKTLFTAALFELTKTNVQTPDPAHANFNVLSGEIKSRGLELEAKGEIVKGLNLSASYTYTDVKNTQNNTASLLGKQPILVPRQAASVWADYTVQGGPLAGAGIGGGARYTGSNYADAANTVKNGGVTVFDAVFHYNLNRWRYALNISNITNKEYTSCLAEPTTTCFWAAERTAILSARYRW